jgi:hypothetical protein
MKIRDLPDPVMAAKADWLAGTRWIGFTPKDDSLNAREHCHAAINGQFRGGYVIEYITLTFGEVNPDFCLVCPTCHRFMHALARRLSDPLAKQAALRPKNR